MAMKRENSRGSREMPRGVSIGAFSDKETAAYQRRTRLQHAQERAQDYVEAIADLISSTGEARATDLARSLGVTHVTVIRTVQRLQREGLVTSLPYRSIFLTEAGRKLASKARSRHRTVWLFSRPSASPPRQHVPMPRESNITSVPKLWPPSNTFSRKGGLVKVAWTFNEPSQAQKRVTERKRRA